MTVVLNTIMVGACANMVTDRKVTIKVTFLTQVRLHGEQNPRMQCTERAEAYFLEDESSAELGGWLMMKVVTLCRESRTPW